MPYLEGTAENDWGKRMFDRLRIVEDKLDQLLVMQQVKLVAIQGMLYGIDNHIDFVVRKFLGDEVSLAHGSSISLLQV